MAVSAHQNWKLPSSPQKRVPEPACASSGTSASLHRLERRWPKGRKMRQKGWEPVQLSRLHLAAHRNSRHLHTPSPSQCRPRARRYGHSERDLFRSRQRRHTRRFGDPASHRRRLRHARSLQLAVHPDAASAVADGQRPGQASIAALAVAYGMAPQTARCAGWEQTLTIAPPAPGGGEPPQRRRAACPPPA